MSRNRAARQELRYAGPPSDYIEDGEYLVECIRSDTKRRIGRLFLRFQVVEEGPWQGKVTFKSYNIATNGNIRPQSKYYADWCRVHKSRPSKKGIEMSPRIFHGRLFKAKIVTKHLRNFETREAIISDDTRYSLVEELIEIYPRS